jgi:hypothetical protein
VEVQGEAVSFDHHRIWASGLLVATSGTRTCLYVAGPSWQQQQKTQMAYHGAPVEPHVGRGA